MTADHDRRRASNWRALWLLTGWGVAVMLTGMAWR
jgi:hypothetical protein